ncbi:MAG: hypothetical protein A2Y84_01895 [Candidatus Colwellbacteria bacterium RBG_13_48_8]|uniref:ParB-like N-terminal domain-containing protein n=1 Tax=Candidatus Colwellbacteria bacterium RBG_13_48_8 TaxID=1797685 RepID=A0A1G1YVI2_9BACT|nr:MAG: hypothetical protein A2Y84_01895 [Candidatus Colwellbacteria bacterium RBG_13_48_8]
MSPVQPRTLVRQNKAVSPKDETRRTEHVFHIEVDKIRPNPHQPRRDFDEGALRELANSIREFGVLQPLVVSKIEKETDTGRTVEYELIAGERRLMAAKMLGLPTVPVMIRHTDREVEKLELAVTENIQRTNLNPIEAARAVARLQDEFGLTQREIAIRLGKSRETIANALRLLNLPSDIQEAIARGKIGESQGRLLLSLGDSQSQQTVFEDLLKNNPSVRDLELRIKRIRGKGQSPSETVSGKSADPEAAALEEQLEELLGTRVSVKSDGKSGRIIINFYSQEEFDAVVSKLLKRSDNLPNQPPSYF